VTAPAKVVARPLWTAADLVAATHGTMTVPFDATGVSIDTRSLRPGDLFVALHGTTDGHAHAADALARGAAGVMLSRKVLPDGAPVLLVEDTLDGLTALGRAGRVRSAGKVVAVTGSVGKTTTKEMLRTVLSAFGPTHAAEASYNNHWGVPLTLARLPADAAFCVAEVGMNNPGEILPLAELVAPDVAVITTIASAHLGHMGSLEAIAEEKATLLDRLAPGGSAVLPAASPHQHVLLAHAPGPVLTFGEADSAVQVLHTVFDAAGTTVQARVAGTPVRFRLAAPGAHMVANALAALAAAHALGLDPARAAAALESFAPMAGRGQQRRIRGGEVLLLDESYNASAISVRAALDVLRLMPGDRHIAVLGDMLELGGFAEAEHAGLAPAVAHSADLLYACGPLTRSLFDRVPQALRAFHAESAETLAPVVAAAVRPGDAVLVKGSLGSRMRVVVRALEDAAAPVSGGHA
jgi:UDP-N-acetylmuramoyl-tripeptide--D-alanyl-D-alanine ligase